jgi:hypothetical protein
MYWLWIGSVGQIPCWNMIYCLIGQLIILMFDDSDEWFID